MDLKNYLISLHKKKYPEPTRLQDHWSPVGGGTLLKGTDPAVAEMEPAEKFTVRTQLRLPPGKSMLVRKKLGGINYVELEYNSVDHVFYLIDATVDKYDRPLSGWLGEQVYGRSHTSEDAMDKVVQEAIKDAIKKDK